MNTNWSDILWYLAIGVFFFMMMRRGGCCGGHGHKRTHREGDANTNTDDNPSGHQAHHLEGLAPEKVVQPTSPNQRRTR